jgi:hypothetical protein
MGWPLVLATIDRRAGPFGLAELLWLLRGLFVSFWGKFGGAGHIALPWPFYVFWAALVGASALGWLWQIANRKSQIGRSANQNVEHVSRFTFHASRFTPHVSLILLGAPLMTLAWLVAYSRAALGTDQGRLLFPAIGPLALLLVGGLAGLQTANSKLQVAGCKLPLRFGVWSGSLALLALLALVFGLWLPFAPPAAPPAAEVTAALPAGQSFGEQIELVSYRWAAGGAESRQLILYWRATRPVPDDLRSALRLVDAQGGVIWEWKRSPGAGRFSTDRWPVGRLVADAYRVPAAALARASLVEVGVRPFPEGVMLPLEGAGEGRFAPITACMAGRDCHE